MQVKDCFILKFREMIRVLHVLGCPIVFILFDDRGWQEGMFRVTKNNHFLVFLAVWILFPNFLGRLRRGSYVMLCILYFYLVCNGPI